MINLLVFLIIITLKTVIPATKIPGIRLHHKSEFTHRRMQNDNYCRNKAVDITEVLYPTVVCHTSQVKLKQSYEGNSKSHQRCEDGWHL